MLYATICTLLVFTTKFLQGLTHSLSQIYIDFIAHTIIFGDIKFTSYTRVLDISFMFR